jgi:hypothetical protein
MRIRYIRFGLVVAGIVVIWGALLPYLATTPTVQQRIDWIQRNRIDPSAMYYSELPLMDDVLRRIEQQ